ncbi:MAG TPA: hypothetical protein VMS77_04095 [Conexivisphaerales archaeon]|nr:hypothetical protein [Conexivisphaerales archaeon]
MARKGVSEIVAALALLGVTIGLSGGLAVTYYGWLNGYSNQNAFLTGEASQLTSLRVYVVGSSVGSPSRVWLLNSGSPCNVTQVYADGSLVLPGQWRLTESVSGSASSLLQPGRMYVLSVNASNSSVVYFDGMLKVQVVLGP